MPRWTRFRQLLGPDPQGDVDDELAFHLDMRADELVARGESPHRAAELSRERFGEFDQTRKACVADQPQTEAEDGAERVGAAVRSGRGVRDADDSPERRALRPSPS